MVNHKVYGFHKNFLQLRLLELKCHILYELKKYSYLLAFLQIHLNQNQKLSLLADIHLPLENPISSKRKAKKNYFSLSSTSLINTYYHYYVILILKRHVKLRILRLNIQYM